METLVDIHSWLRWLVLAAVGAAAVAGFVGFSTKKDWNDRGYSIAAIIVDVQVTIGLILWLFNEGWDQGFFIAVIHPVLMLAAVAVVHIVIKRARAQGGSQAHLTAAIGMTVSLVLIIAAVPWQRL